MPAAGSDAAPPPSRSLPALLRRLGPLLLDILYPRRCVLCGSAEALHEQWPLCLPCLRREDLFSDGDPLCPRCAMPTERFFAREVPGGCRWCADKMLAFDRAASGGPFRELLREEIHLYKYRERLQLRDHIVHVAAGAARRLPLSEETLLVPVPSARSRIRRRGYDPILELARPLSNLLGAPLRNILERAKDTPPLADLSPAARAKAVKGAFRMKDTCVPQGAEVIVLDDILTTGATISEAASVLKRAGAGRVFALTAARTLDTPSP